MEIVPGDFEVLCDVVVKKFTFAISSPDEFLLYKQSPNKTLTCLLTFESNSVNSVINRIK